MSRVQYEALHLNIYVYIDVYINIKRFPFKELTPDKTVEDHRYHNHYDDNNNNNKENHTNSNESHGIAGKT